MLSLIKAFFMMLKAHKGQIDKAGKPYMFHPINVALGVRGVRAKTVALLHDILEDSNLYSFDDFDFLDLLRHHNDGDGLPRKKNQTQASIK